MKWRKAALVILPRVLVAPAVIALATLCWLFLPIWLLLTAAISPWLPGARWRPLRLLWLIVLALTVEAIALVELFGLWIASGFGLFIRRPWFERVHYDLVDLAMRLFFAEARRVIRLKIVTAGSDPGLHVGTPLIVCSRHAGPVDSFLLVYALMRWYRREPRVVLRDALSWDPCISVLLRRLPARFISPDPKAGANVEDEIADLATGLDHNDAFLIFPEGGNFSPERRERAIAKLQARGLHKMAERADKMINVIAPRPGGFIAALDAAPDADVVLVAHTGVDRVYTIADIWHELPLDKRITMQFWQVPRAEIPVGREARIDWLFGWWEDIDRWIAENRPEALPPTGSRGLRKRSV